VPVGRRTRKRRALDRCAQARLERARGLAFLWHSAKSLGRECGLEPEFVRLATRQLLHSFYYVAGRSA
jgi:hypothetical protein